MEETIITWNVTNWITIVLMAALGFAVLSLIAQLFHKARGTQKQTTVGTSLSATPQIAG